MSVLAGALTHLAFRADGERIAGANEAGEIWVWDTATGGVVMSLAHRGAITTLAFSPDGTRVVTERDPPPRLPHGTTITAFAFSPNERWIATANADRTATLWDAATGEPVIASLPHSDDLTAVAFSADGTRLITVAHGLRVWDITPATQVPMTTRSDACIESAAFSDDGAQLVTASELNIQRWDAWTGNPTTAPLDEHDHALAAGLRRKGRMWTLQL